MVAARDLRLLMYFVRIARAGSIRRAAAELRLSPAVVSEALSDLEESLDATLIRRTTRSMALTDAGEALFEHAAAMVAAADRAMALRGADAGGLEGVVRVTLPVELGAVWLPDRLSAFEVSNPAVRVEINASDAMVDLAASDFDVAVRARYRPEPPGPKDLPLELVCAPHLLGPAAEPLALRVARLGIVGGGPSAPGGVGARNRVALQATPRQGGPSTQIEAPRRLHVDSQAVAHRMAVEGFGAALLIGAGLDDDFATGRLAQVDPHYTFGSVRLDVAMRDRYPTPAARALRDTLLEPG